MTKIKSLKNISFNKLFEASSEAFKDYDFQVNKTELQTILIRRGFVPELSFGAFINDRLVSFTCNGIGLFKGLKTAYDTGTATIKEYRGQGLASEIFKHSLPYLKEAGVVQYLLEVLQHNEKAVSLYKKIGFVITREFNYFDKESSNIKLYKKVVNPEYQVKEIDLSQIELMSSFQDFTPSWQNSFDSIKRKQEDFVLHGVFSKEQLIGYCVFEPISGDITQIAVDKKHRRQGIGSKLLEYSLKSNQSDSVKMVNTNVNCKSITDFIKANSFTLSGKQFEMIKKL